MSEKVGFLPVHFGVIESKSAVVSQLGHVLKENCRLPARWDFQSSAEASQFMGSGCGFVTPAYCFGNLGQPSCARQWTIEIKCRAE